MMFKACVVIPVYNHEQAIAVVVTQVLAHDLLCILVDDGSNAACAAVLDALAASAPQRLILLRHASNCGKGAAVLTGMRYAYAAGYSHALQVDADGQHNVSDFPAFLALAARYPAAVIAGCPIYDETVPALRLYARYLTHVWVWINTLSFQIKDSMCGFRVYPLACVTKLAAHKKLGSRMNFDTEVLVRLHWEAVQIINLPTRVSYPLDGVSHFRVWLDNVLITRMHTSLFFGMLWRSPRLLWRKWRTR